ncbi:MAG: Gfo/Idh/MocA family oxidoreductase [Bacteroidota bacterium]
MNNTNTPLRIAVFGLGHLGKIHIRCLLQLPQKYQIIGCYDPDTSTATQVHQLLDVPIFTDPDQLMQVADVVDIVAPTFAHLTLALAAIAHGKHVFIEKPIANTVDEAEQIVASAKKAGVKVQIGHVERFNPAFLALDPSAVQPMFIEAHRLATFNPRGTDVSVVLDLMIHDLDVVLSLVDAPPVKVSASGVAVVSPTPDITNARIEFANGCVANLTASRISLKQMRKLRLFQRDAYISVDFLQKETQIIRLTDADTTAEAALMQMDTATGKKNIVIEMPSVEENNAIRDELATFADAILEDRPVVVSASDGTAALALATWILDEIRSV